MIQYPTDISHIFEYLFFDDAGQMAYMDAPTTYSMAAVVRLENTTDAGDRIIIGKINPAYTTGWAWLVRDNTTIAYAPELVHGSGTTNRVTASTALTINTTYLIGVTYDGSNADFYVDGLPDGTPAFTANPSAIVEDVGIGNIDGANRGWTGALGMMWWWDVMLTAAEMKDLFHGSIPKSNDLLFWIDMMHPTTSPVGKSDSERPHNRMKHSQGGLESAFAVSGQLTRIPLTGQAFKWVWPNIGAGNADSFDPTQVSAAGIISAALSLEISGLKRVHPALTLTIGKTTRRYGSEGLRSVSRGLFRSQITSWGQGTIATDDETLRLETTGLTITIVDEDGDLTALIMQNRRSFVGSIATIRYTSQTLTTTNDEFEVFRGRVVEAVYRFGSRGKEWQIRLEQGFDVTTLARVPTVTLDSHTNAPADSLGLKARAVYGRWLSDGLAAKGMIECPLVDVANNIYQVSIGELNDVPNFYVDGVVNSDPNNSKAFALFGGIPYTTIEFQSALADGAVVTADAIGLTFDASTGVAAPILNPADQLLHALVNFYRNEWRVNNDPWFVPDGNEFNLTSFDNARNYFDLYGYEGSMIVEAQSGRELISQWSSDQQINVFWESGLTLRVDDPHFDQIYANLIHHRHVDQRGELTTDFSQRSMVSEVLAEYVKSEADGTTFQTLTVRDANATIQGKKTLSIETAVATVARK